MRRIINLLERIANALEDIASRDESTTHHYFEDDPYHPRYPASTMILSMDDIILAGC